MSLFAAMLALFAPAAAPEGPAPGRSYRITVVDEQTPPNESRAGTGPGLRYIGPAIGDVGRAPRRAGDRGGTPGRARRSRRRGSSRVVVAVADRAGRVGGCGWTGPVASFAPTAGGT